MQISIIADDLVKSDKAGYLGNVSGFTTINGLEMFAKICLKYHICCALFFNKKRNLDDFREIWFLQFDFDNGITCEEVISKLGSSTNVVVMASKNHMKDKNDGKGQIPRFHVFLPLTKPITDPDFYHFIVKSFAKRMQIPIDPQATDATRYMYKHSKCLHIKETGWNTEITDKHMLEWNAENERIRKENEERTEKLKKDNAAYQITFDDRYAAAQKLVGDYVGQSVEGMGGDRTTFKAMCYGIKCGLNESFLLKFANWYNDNFCNPKWSSKALTHKIKSAKKKVLSGDCLHPKYIMKVIGKSDSIKQFFN